MHRNWTVGLVATAFFGLTGCQGDSVEMDPGAQSAGMASECFLPFSGISSCAVGGAKLNKTDQGLVVTGLTTPGANGVSSSFAGAKTWSQQALVQGFGSLTLTAHYGEQSGGSLRIIRGDNSVAERSG